MEKINNLFEPTSVASQVGKNMYRFHPEKKVIALDVHYEKTNQLIEKITPWTSPQVDDGIHPWATRDVQEIQALKDRLEMQKGRIIQKLNAAQSNYQQIQQMAEKYLPQPSPNSEVDSEEVILESWFSEPQPPNQKQSLSEEKKRSESLEQKKMCRDHL